MYFYSPVCLDLTHACRIRHGYRVDIDMHYETMKLKDHYNGYVVFGKTNTKGVIQFYFQP